MSLLILFPASGPVTYNETGNCSAAVSITGAAAIELIGSGNVSVDTTITGTALVNLVSSGDVSVTVTITGVETFTPGTLTYNETGDCSVVTTITGAATVYLVAAGTITTSTTITGNDTSPETTTYPFWTRNSFYLRQFFANN